MTRNIRARKQEEEMFSIIVPTFNEVENISKCLNSILNQDFPREKFEVIVVDNGSKDHTLETASKFSEIYTYHKPGINVGAVRNYGASRATGSILVFVDGDCVLDHCWLQRAQLLLRMHPGSVFGGGAKLPHNPKWIERYWLLEKNGLPTLPKNLIGASIVIRKTIFDEVKGFNDAVTAGEDSKLHQELERIGVPVKICHDLDIVHLGNAKTVKDFLRRQMWQAENYRKSFKNVKNDKIFWATLFYGLSSFFGISSLIYGSEHAMLSILATQIPAASLTFKRLVRINLFPRNPGFYFSCLVMDNLYLVGRVAGLVLGPAKKK